MPQKPHNQAIFHTFYPFNRKIRWGTAPSERITPAINNLSGCKQGVSTQSAYPFL